MSEILTVDDTLFIGAGGHQSTYIHPLDAAKCIKIPHDANDGDLKKELRYRRICAEKLSESKLVTKFYGTVNTNLKLGYVFERVLDYNGNTSKDLKIFLNENATDVEKCRAILLAFKEDFLRESIAIVDTDITNFMVQEISREDYQIRIVDNIGTPVLIPLVYYSQTAARWKAKRVRRRPADWLGENYPEIVSAEFLTQLKI